MDKYRTSVPVHLTHDQIMALRDLVMRSDLDNPMRNDIINELAAGLLRFGSPIWENKVKCTNAKDGNEKSCRNCRHVCFDDNGQHKDDADGCPKWASKAE